MVIEGNKYDHGAQNILGTVLSSTMRDGPYFLSGDHIFAIFRTVYGKYEKITLLLYEFQHQVRPSSPARSTEVLIPVYEPWRV